MSNDAWAPPHGAPESLGSGGCSTCGQQCCTCCCNEFWQHRTGFFGGLVYLHATDVDMAHAIQQNGAGGVGGLGTNPNGRVATVDPDYEPGFFLGWSKAMDDCSSIVSTYTRFQSHADDFVQAQPGVGSSVASLVLAPGTNTAGIVGTSAAADYDIDFQTADIDYRRLLAGGCNHAINYTLGLRYGNLEQGFKQIGQFAQPLGVSQVITDIDFEGAGLKFGLDGSRRIGHGGLSFYGKGFLSVLFGEFKSSYSQTNTTVGGTARASSFWDDDRVLPILEYELGVAWTSCSGRWHATAGYYTSFWFNAVTTPEYVRAVQNADFVNLGDTVVFNGFTSRLEYRF